MHAHIFAAQGQELARLGDEQDPQSRIRETTFYPITPPARPSYVFVGFRPFNRAAAEKAELDLNDPDTLQHLDRSEASWHAKQLGQALGSLPELAPAAQAQAYARIQALHRSIAVLKSAAEDAILEAALNLGLEPPAFLRGLAEDGLREAENEPGRADSDPPPSAKPSRVRKAANPTESPSE